MVGAVLTIAGDSINDTIVVFDRIREGMRAAATGSLEFIMNRATNETLSRTILTGGTTLLSTLALYVLGGAVLHDFAFTISCRHSSGHILIDLRNFSVSTLVVAMGSEEAPGITDRNSIGCTLIHLEN